MGHEKWGREEISRVCGAKLEVKSFARTTGYYRIQFNLVPYATMLYR